MVWSSVDQGKGKLEVVLYGSQNVSGWMMKTKLVLITELVVILNNSEVIHL